MKKILLTGTILFTLFAGIGCSQTTPSKETPKEIPQKTITISAAASLKDALTELQPKFEKENNAKLSFNFGASGTLQKQIEQGAPTDLFISAGKKQMDDLEKGNLIDKNSRKDVLKNKLVLIVSNDYKDKIKTTSDLVTITGKIAMGETSTVPAGQYGKESLESLKLMDKLTDKLVYAKDVKQVVAYVEKGEAAVGIVYKSDATVLKNSSILEELAETSHKPILYPAAIVSGSKEKELANKFLQYLNSSESERTFEKYGFVIPSK